MFREILTPLDCKSCIKDAVQIISKTLRNGAILD